MINEVSIYIYTTVKGPKKRHGAYAYLLEVDTNKGPATCSDTGRLEDVTEHTTMIFNQLQGFYQKVVAENTEWEQEKKELFKKWFESIKGTLESAENGELLMQLNEMLNAMRIATDTDIENIIGGEYVDDDDGSSIFETASDDDIEAIINGTYIDSGDDSDDEIITTSEEKVVKIVNQTFK